MCTRINCEPSITSVELVDITRKLPSREIFSMARKIVGAALVLVVLCVSLEAGAYLCNKRLDIVIAADVSGSMIDSQFRQLQTFLSTLVDNIKISKSNGARVIVFAFDDQINSLTSSFSDRVTRVRSEIKRQINSLQFTAGATVITTAITEAKKLLNSTNRDNAQKVVVFVTDGVNFGGTDSLDQPARELRNTFNARVIGLGIGEGINVPGLRVLTGRNDRDLNLTFETSSGGKCCDDDDRKRRRRDDDDDDDECDDRRRRRRRRDDDDDDDDDGGCSSGVSNELKKVINLICHDRP